MASVFMAFIIKLKIDSIYACGKPILNGSNTLHIKSFETIFELLINWGMFFNDANHLLKYFPPSFFD